MKTPMRCWPVLCLLTCVVLLACVMPVSGGGHVRARHPAPVVHGPERWQQPRLAVSLWVDPIVSPKEFPERYAEIADAKLTAVIGGFGAKTPSAVEAQIAAAEQVGLGVVVAGVSRPRSQSASPALWGYQLRDEPSAAEFQALRAESDEIARDRPGKLRFINILPNYAAPSLLNTTSYSEYVRRFVDEVDPDVLSTDHYPRFDLPDSSENTLATRAGYRAQLDLLRTEAARARGGAGIPFWNFFNTMPFAGYADPTESQLRWQVFTSLAYGAKGIMYFCWWTPDDHKVFAKGGAIITPVGKSVVYHRGPHYKHAQALNTKVLAYENHLFPAVSTGVWHIKLDGGAATSAVEDQLKGSAVTDIVDLRGSFLVGQFRLNDGRTCVLLHNQDDGNSAWPTVSFADPAVLEVSTGTGDEAAVVDDSPYLPGLQLALGPGDARLFVVGGGE